MHGTWGAPGALPCWSQLETPGRRRQLSNGAAPWKAVMLRLEPAVAACSCGAPGLSGAHGDLGRMAVHPQLPQRPDLQLTEQLLGDSLRVGHPVPRSHAIRVLTSTVRLGLLLLHCPILEVCYETFCLKDASDQHRRAHRRSRSAIGPPGEPRQPQARGSVWR